MFGGDEIGALVFDLGSETFRVGAALDDRPKVQIPTVIGVSNDGTADTSQLEPDAKQGNCVNKSSKYYVDITSLCVPRKGTHVFKIDHFINNIIIFLIIIIYYFRHGSSELHERRNDQ